MNAVVAARGKHFVRPAAGDNRIPIVAGSDGIVARAQTEICRTLRPGEVLPFVAECQVAGQVLGGDVAVRKPDRPSSSAHSGLRFRFERSDGDHGEGRAVGATALNKYG